MSARQVDDAAIERAAVAIARQQGEAVQDYHYDDARAALQAAYPVLVAENERLREALEQANRDRIQLYEQVNEFREKCDPREDVVLCTAAEIHGASFYALAATTAEPRADEAEK